MALPATDDFTGDDNPLTDRTGWTILPVVSETGQSLNGTYRDTGNGDDKGCYWDADTFSDDQYAQLDVLSSITGTSRIGLILRASTSTDVATLLRFKGDGNFEAYVWDSGGSRNALSGNPFTPSATVTVGDTIRVEIDSATDTLTLLVDYGSGFVTENTWDASSGNSSGQPGIYIANAELTNLWGDNWEAGDLDAGGDTNVNVSTEALTITEQAATISLDINVAANVEALTITEFAATIDLDVNIAASTEALVITENVASITLDVAVNVATESLTITSFQAVVDVSGTTEVIVNTESLVLTPNQATIQVGLNTEIAASVEALVLTGQQASIGIDVNVLANTESLVLTTNAAAIQVGTNVLASVASLVITENAATITKNIAVEASTEALVITPLSATVVSSGATTLSAQDVINIVDAIFAHVVENSETFNQQLRLIRAEAAGKLAVVGTTVTLRDSADTKDRITATVDNDGQRTSITTDVS